MRRILLFRNYSYFGYYDIYYEKKNCLRICTKTVTRRCHMWLTSQSSTHCSAISFIFARICYYIDPERGRHIRIPATYTAPTHERSYAGANAHHIRGTFVMYARGSWMHNARASAKAHTDLKHISWKTSLKQNVILILANNRRRGLRQACEQL